MTGSQSDLKSLLLTWNLRRKFLHSLRRHKVQFYYLSRAKTEPDDLEQICHEKNFSGVCHSIPTFYEPFRIYLIDDSFLFK